MKLKADQSRFVHITCMMLLSAVLALALCECIQSAPRSGDLRLPIRFAVIGDRTGGHEAGIHVDILEEIERMKPDFVVGVGDMIEGYTGDTGEIERQWEEYEAMIDMLSMPFYLVPGNHDIWDSTSGEFYERHAGEPYYSFDTGPIHFVVLDTSRWPTVSTFPEEQVDWLKSDLAENREAKYTIVIYHIPYWIETVARSKPDPLHDIFVANGVDAVFTGHYHVYFAGTYDGIAYTGVGSSGGVCEPGLTGLKYHFMWVTADESGLTIAPIKMGSVLPWEEVAPEEFNLVEEIKQEAVRADRIRVGTAGWIERADLKVTVRNYSGDSTLIGTLDWEEEGDWRVRPKRLPIQIAPGESHEAVFKVETPGPLYPTPVLSMDYPHAGRSIEIETTLPLIRTAYANKADLAPKIDGRLSEPVWKEPVTDLYTGEGFSETADSTYFYFAWDEANLYIGAVCVEGRMDSMVATVSEHDGAIYGEDCVGFFFQSDVPDGPVYQMYFNPLGIAFDQKIAVEGGRYTDVDRGWDGSYETAILKGPDRWTFEASIPLEQMGAAGQYEDTWAVNFRRKQKRLETSADWQVPITYDPIDYGHLIMQ